MTHLDTQKRYIGLTRRNFETRWREHVSRASKQKTGFHFHAALAKHGLTAFTREPVETLTGTLGQAQEAEQWWIAHFGSDDPKLGYNGTSGGDGHNMTEETRRKLSEAHRRVKASQSPERRREIAIKGRPAAVATVRAKTPEERARIAALKLASTKKNWEQLSHEEQAERRARLGAAISAGRIRARAARETTSA